MAKELFRAVQTAEEKAEIILQDAQNEARELLKTVEADIAANERDMALKHRAMFQQAMDEKRRSISERIAANAPQVKASQAESLSQAKERLAEAAAHIVERVWDDGNR